MTISSGIGMSACASRLLFRVLSRVSMMLHDT